MKSLILLPFLLVVSPLHAEMPATLGEWVTSDGSFPVWVRADLVFQATGSIDRTYVPYTHDRLERLLPAMTDGECIDENDRPIIISDVPAITWNTFHQGIEETQNILTGTVTDAAPGLIGESLGTLMRLEGFRFLRRNPRLDTSDEYFLHLDIARFELDGRTFCVEDNQQPALPEIGERVIVFPTYFMLKNTMIVRGIIIERKSGEIEYSTTLSGLPTDKSFDDLVTHIVDLASDNNR
ncbi:MAG: hypothetical protein AAGD38_07015 [Acidobacteriota bacterium]